VEKGFVRVTKFFKKAAKHKKKELESLERKKLTSRKHSKNIEVVLDMLKSKNLM
jgi:hypothetical protein